DLSVTDGRAVTADDRLPAGTTYAGESVRPIDDERALRTAGRNYPAGVADRFTQLPDDTPSRLGSFTDRLTADADSPYEAARTIEAWLETNKTYSLSAQAPETDNVATTFAFEMDTGYCEYFASTMVAMLRTQDIPARYVVGYSTGQETSEDTYTVRGMNAHAWVEMYVPDVGWVQFDPTPGQARLATERDALESQRPESPAYDPTEQGSPNETFSPDDPATPPEDIDPTPTDPATNGTDTNGTDTPNGTDSPEGTDPGDTPPDGTDGSPPPDDGTDGAPGDGTGDNGADGGTGGNETLPDDGTGTNGTEAPNGTDGTGDGDGSGDGADGGPGGTDGGGADGAGDGGGSGDASAPLSVALDGDPVPGSDGDGVGNAGRPAGRRRDGAVRRRVSRHDGAERHRHRGGPVQRATERHRSHVQRRRRRVAGRARS
ncbi:transglutaminase domain-containing protein, partial [Halapricum sp. CBA1109]|uniref:transglutaminase domain-containing protein n=1 Tax=Halapricum sp. CBA1109 TaxID=2668068 RepID=UPI00272EC46D